MKVIDRFDKLLVLFIRENCSNSYFDFILLTYSELGDRGIIWIFLSVLMIAFFKNYKTCGILSLISLGTTAFLGNIIIKPLISRQRPFIGLGLNIIISPPHGYSFPSGHTSAAFAFAYIVHHFNRRLGYLAYFLAFLMGFSRMYLSVHYLSDVIAGALLGIIVSALLIKFYDMANKLIIKKQSDRN